MPELADAGSHPVATLPQVPVLAPPPPVPASYDYAFLYPWQQEALKAWHSNARRGVVEAVTGSGKTRVGIAAAFEAVRQASGPKSGDSTADTSSDGAEPEAGSSLEPLVEPPLEKDYASAPTSFDLEDSGWLEELQGLEGFSDDGVSDYLQRAGRADLLTAEQEVELAKDIEAGLYAAHLLADGTPRGRKESRELRVIALLGERAADALLEANLRLVISIAKRYLQVQPLGR